MSTEPATVRRLADWLRELVEQTDLDPLGGGARLRTVLGARRARIALDDDVVEVTIRGRSLEVGPPQPNVPADGAGATTTGVVLALLDGSLEVSTALHDGLIQTTGSREAITRIFHAIELILDVSSRVPELRLLADDFRHQTHEPAAVVMNRAAQTRRDEHALLERLDLMGNR